MVIKVESIEFDKYYATQEVHFTGGLRGIQTVNGWALFPISENTDLNALEFKTREIHYRFATQECGLRYIGTCVQYRNGANSPPMDIWEPGDRDPSNDLNAADSWGAISDNARLTGDTVYADCASYVSVCLKVAGLRLRDVSNKYHDQLNWALLERKKSGTWFSNIALLELYADFHSLVSELSSTRDYLAKLAAIHAFAPDRIDSLARLESWLKKDANEACKHEPLIALLISASGTKDSPSWLRRLGDIRNEMIHRIPMGANKLVSGLTLQEAFTNQGTIKKIRLADPNSDLKVPDFPIDPLVELSQLSTKFEHLCRAARKLARYPAELPLITTLSPT